MDSKSNPREVPKKLHPVSVTASIISPHLSRTSEAKSLSPRPARVFLDHQGELDVLGAKSWLFGFGDCFSPGKFCGWRWMLRSCDTILNSSV
ncbi:hypothetical protein J5N97_028139 [Dioscorea zingiberensis]|uniref:Uncharacterized protein n=1 Tax=Dioscorea zingiberensis TaxID=325984 RepID=A0A9D5H4I2_9LILI|nr:hypothetical protein J5N97_028139 [Dioscorea zingiberensis]